ncbi:MAG: class I tRNA ligase family protein, partial [Bdellovibrionota bacterium]
LYCESCEAYYTEKDLVNGNCPSHGKPPKFISEENYFFRLSKYQDRLLALFREHPDFLEPAYRRAEVVNFIQAGLKDFSISRSTFTWGVPLPFDPKSVVYVWFDALLNYVTAAGYLTDPAGFARRWPAKLHIIGKDITRFHCVYWPAMLMSLDLPLPEKVFAHGYITIKGEKLSKSTGNLVLPDEVMAITGPDAFRYYLLAENQFSQDGNFAMDLLVLKNNADLANDFGNLINRSISMTRKYFPGEKLAAPSAVTHSAEVRASFEKLPGELAGFLAAVDPSGYAAACTARSRVLNLYIDRTKPWALAKDPAKREELHEVMYTLLEGIRWVATCLMPILPFGMPEVFRQLAQPVPPETGALPALKWGVPAFEPGEPKPVFPRIELPKAEG